jgi:hypothetical protein
LKTVYLHVYFPSEEEKQRRNIFRGRPRPEGCSSPQGSTKFTILGFIIDKIILFKIPIVIWVSLLALFVSSPICPGNDFIVEQTEKINFMAIATPILAYAGLSFGKDLKEFRKLSCRIGIISIVVYTGTFVLSTLIAEVGFRLTGKFVIFL